MLLYSHAFVSVAKIVDNIAFAYYTDKFPGAPPQSVVLLLMLLHQ
jgi:hypothetical protein